MPRSGLRAHHSLSVLSILALFITTFSPISLSPATAAPALVTCVNLQTGTERISHTGKCRYTQEAQANWHKNQSDSPIASGPTAKVINICSNKESSPVSYQVIRKKCARHQVTTIFSRSGSLPAKPVIVEAVSFGHDSASLKLAIDPATSVDAPIAFYTITSTTVDTRTAVIVQSQKVYYWKDLNLAINTLQASTRYTFTVSATTVDGTSAISALSNQVTTPAFVAPTSTSSSSLAVPAFTLSSTSEVKTVNNAIAGYTISSTGGAIASYSISPAAPSGTTFNTSTGLLSGNPTATQTATAYTITGTNASGSAARTFTLTVNALTAPVFSLSKIAETATAYAAPVGFGYTIDASAGGAVASYALTGTLPAGLTFSTSTGLITGSPTETKTATTYTITATNGAGSSSATYRLRVTGDIGDVGPGGGRIFYYLAAGFNCGANFTVTGSPTGGKCKYLEVAPTTWKTPQDDVPGFLGINGLNRIDSQTVTGVPQDGTTRVLSSDAIGLGYQNSLAFFSDSRASDAGAVKIARNYNGGGLSDWYVPTTSELNLLCQWSKNKTQRLDQDCGAGSVSNGDFFAATTPTVLYYWSSSIYFNSSLPFTASGSRNIGFILGFGNGTFTADNWSSAVAYLRPIRAF